MNVLCWSRIMEITLFSKTKLRNLSGRNRRANYTSYYLLRGKGQQHVIQRGAINIFIIKRKINFYHLARSDGSSKNYDSLENSVIPLGSMSRCFCSLEQKRDLTCKQETVMQS